MGSNLTMVKVATAKMFVENHYKNHIKSIQERKERRTILERKLASSDVPDEERIKLIKDLERKETEYLRLKRHKLCADDFEVLTIIGRGSFGEVRLCREKRSGNIYAMKRLKKSERLKVQCAKAERNFFAEVSNKFIVKLYYSFQDANYLYLIMEYMPGGDLRNLLIKEDTLSENVAKFYIAQCVLAIESIHKHGYIHRDIKPDNILLDVNGHLKLTDFGLCKPPDCINKDSMIEFPIKDDGKLSESLDTDEQGSGQMNRRKLAFSAVGTPYYMAPEVIMKIGYGVECDWWSLGVIIYEMLVGRRPFHSNGPKTVSGKILNWRTSLKFPEDAQITLEARDIICKLLCDVDQRLGTKGPHEIKAHPWFNGVEWDKLYEMEAPFKPQVNGELDTQKLKFGEEDPPKTESTRAAGPSWKMPKDPKFIGYTYMNFDVVKGLSQSLGDSMLDFSSPSPAEETVSQILRSPSDPDPMSP